MDRKVRATDPGKPPSLSRSASTRPWSLVDVIPLPNFKRLFVYHNDAPRRETAGSVAVTHEPNGETS